MSDALAVDGQVLKGLLDTLVMRELLNGPGYGFGIQAALEKDLGPDAQVLKLETLYPLLHRLEGRGLLASHHEPGERGRPRRYYRLTTAGNEFFEQRVREWRLVSDLLDRMVLSPLSDEAPQFSTS